jgi:MFS transporter, PPP family, 3-phenylpropionic acid transporter
VGVIRRRAGDDLRSIARPRFMLLYAAMYAAFGVASPFLPAFLSARELSAAQLGLVLGAGTAVRLLTGPLAGRTGDVLQGLRLVLVVCTVLAAAVTLGYLPAQGLWPLLASLTGASAVPALRAGCCHARRGPRGRRRVHGGHRL